MSSEFNPKCYDFYVDTFKISLPYDTRDIRVTCPDFAHLLDHTIAVLWKMFSKNFSDVDQFHLVWALKFLEGIKGNKLMSVEIKSLENFLRTLVLHKYTKSDLTPKRLNPNRKVRLMSNPQYVPRSLDLSSRQITTNTTIMNSTMFNDPNMNEAFLGDKCIDNNTQILSDSGGFVNNTMANDPMFREYDPTWRRGERERREYWSRNMHLESAALKKLGQS